MTLKIVMDHPHLRAGHICPLCDGVKDSGLVCCWLCFRKYDLRSGNEAAESMIDAKEHELALISAAGRVS